MKTIAVEKAVAMIPNGASMIGGFVSMGTPERLIVICLRLGADAQRYWKLHRASLCRMCLPSRKPGFSCRTRFPK